jgi:hypothetical protein
MPGSERRHFANACSTLADRSGERKEQKNRTEYIVNHLENTLTTPSPPPLTTDLPSRLQTTEQTPSPRIKR